MFRLPFDCIVMLIRSLQLIPRRNSCSMRFPGFLGSSGSPIAPNSRPLLFVALEPPTTASTYHGQTDRWNKQFSRK